MEIQKPGRHRRHHSEEFKQAVIEACCEPGASVAGIAMANGVNANQVRRWMRERSIEVPKQRKRKRKRKSKPSLGAAGAGLSSAGMQDVVRIVAAVAVAGLVWLVVDRAADVTGLGQFIVTATAAAVTMAVMYARGPKLGLAVAAVCAVVAVVSAHWWWAAAAVLMVLGGILTAGWRKNP